ncbi:MAG: chemotaxis protein CheW [Zoogloeaceae bacterium]|nr:chemotaxis protein CheW [Rhodocyclaceae bacterium]MCP5235308.1 chemotaxis protein CheW [Zoogloeaceae bacterium]
MARRTSLREFQESLARRLAEAGSAQPRALLGLQSGNDHWLIALPEAGEIMPVPDLTTVPLAKPWMRGLANVRGTLYSAVDFSAFHGGEQILPAGEARLILVGARLGSNCALLVSRTTGLRGVEDFELEPEAATEPGQPWRGPRMRDTTGRLWTRLLIPALLADRSFLEASAA